MNRANPHHDHGIRCTPERMRGLFRAHGLRCTKQREMIYAALATTDLHPTAEELFQAVRQDDPGLSLATVYNTLDVFTDRGLCRRIPSPNGNGPSRFDADTDQHAHILLDDGRVLDIPPDLAGVLEGAVPPRIREALESRLGIRITGVQVQLAARRREAGAGETP